MNSSDNVIAAGFVLFLVLTTQSIVVNAQENQMRLSAEDTQRVENSEEQLKLIIQNTLSNSSNSFSANRKVVSLSGKQAALSALEKNLSIKRGELFNKIAEQTLVEARAVFDSVLTTSITFEQNKRENRIENVRRFQSALSDEGTLEVDRAFDPRNPVIVFTPEEAGERTEDGFADSKVVASQSPLTGDDDKWTFAAGVEKTLPWGGSIQVEYKAINKETHFINNPNLYTNSPNPPLELIGFGSYNRPWISELVANMVTPVPGTKGFGKHSPSVVNKQKLALQREASSFEVKALVNNTLKSIDSAYWNLVESALALEAAEQSKLAADEQLKSTKRLFKGRSANNFDLTQSEIAVTQAQQSSIQFWSSYVSASDNMVNLLDLPANSLIIPQGFAAMLVNKEVSPASVKVGQNHPEIDAKILDTSISEIDSDASRSDTKLDLALTAELGLRQSNAVFGYESLADSLSSVFEPDVSTQKVGLIFTRPIGNRGAQAGNRSALAKQNQSELILQAARNSQESEVQIAKAQLHTAIVLQEHLNTAYHLAFEAYAKAREQQKRRNVREFELSNQLTTLLEANLSHIRALVGIKRAETAVLEAQGVLAQRYGQKITSRDHHNRRLVMQVDDLQSQFFLPGGKVQ